MVFETEIADLLNDVLSEYVDGFSSKDVEFSGWNTFFKGGLAELEVGPLKLRPQALQQLLPVHIISGQLKTLKVCMDITDLVGTPVKIHIEDLSIVCEADADASVDTNPDAASETMRSVAIKTWQTYMNQRFRAGSKEDEGMAARIQYAVMRNFVLEVERVHLRIEAPRIKDNPPQPEEDTVPVLGFVINEITADSRDSTFQHPHRSQKGDGETVLYKLIRMDGVGIYLDPNSIHANSWRHANALVWQSDKELQPASKLPYIIAPQSSELRVTKHENPSVLEATDKPALNLDFIFGSLDLTLTDAQFDAITTLIKSFSVPGTTKSRPEVTTWTRAFRPRFGFRTNNYPSERFRVASRWAYAAQCMGLRGSRLVFETNRNLHVASPLRKGSRSTIHPVMTRSVAEAMGT